MHEHYNSDFRFIARFRFITFSRINITVGITDFASYKFDYLLHVYFEYVLSFASPGLA